MIQHIILKVFLFMQMPKFILQKNVIMQPGISKAYTRGKQQLHRHICLTIFYHNLLYFIYIFFFFIFYILSYYISTRSYQLFIDVIMSNFLFGPFYVIVLIYFI